MPSAKETIGCSYQYNILPFSPMELEHPQDGTIASQRIDWVPNPAKFVLMHEPPARNWGKIRYHWHYAQANRTVIDSTFHSSNGDLAVCDDEIDLKDDTAKFLSPVLFVDGHVESVDFTASIKTNPRRTHEETGKWIWYRPVPPPPPSNPDPTGQP